VAAEDDSSGDRLRALVQGQATGNNLLGVWQVGEGPFVDGPVAPGLRLRVDPRSSRHGFIEPDREMTLDDYQAALAATRDLWVRIAEDQP